MGSILCADIGTTSLKVGIVDSRGEVVSFCVQRFDCEDSSFVADKWVSAFICGAEDCIDACEYVRNFSLDAVCISGNGPTVVSENGRTLLWNAEPLSPELKKKLSESLPETASLFLPRFALFKALYKEDWEKSGYIFSGPEYLVYKLTGTAVCVLPESRFESSYWSQALLDEFGIEKEKIPPFVPLGFNAGPVARSVARKLFGNGCQADCSDAFISSASADTPNFSGEHLWKAGVLKKIPVFCGGPDFIAALIGTGTLCPGRICDRAGSSEGLNLCTEKPVFAENVRTLPGVLPGLWNASVLLGQSGSLLNEFRSQIDSMEDRYNSFSEIIDFSFDDRNSEGYRIFTALCENVKDGAGRLRAVAAENNLPFDGMMRVTGGQAKNDRWLEERAVALGISLAVMNCADAELVGNAVVAAVGLGRYPDIKRAADVMVRIRKVYPACKSRGSSLKVYRLPPKISAVIFDIDSTLYTSTAYAFEQVDVQIREFAKKQGITAVQARNMISEWRRKWSRENGGKKISLGNTLTHFGVPIEESIRMRRELLEPSKFLGHDARLFEVLSLLKRHYPLICVTNNPVLPARKTLDALGVSSLIPEIIGLDTCGKSKPSEEPFELAVEKLGVPASETVSVGDRYDIDLAVPLSMGMGAVLVGGVDDVYLLPEILLNLS